MTLAVSFMPGLLASEIATPGGAVEPSKLMHVARPEGASRVLGIDPTQQLRLHGSDAHLARLAIVEGPDDHLPHAVRVDVPTALRRGSAVMLAIENTAPVHRGDILLAEFWARSARSRDETAESTINFFFESVNPPRIDDRGHTDNPTGRVIGATFSSTLSMHRVGPAWRYLVVPFRVHGEYAPGKARMGFDVAFADQAVEVAGFQVWNYGRTRTLAEMPRVDRTTYAGRSPDAPWRAQAAERIERIRKADMTIRVVDSQGNPIQDANVNIEMQRHAFAFGTAIDAKTLLGDGPDNETYRQHILQLFNTVVFGNDLKWPQWEMPEWRQRVEPALQWLEQHGLSVRGHVLLWGSYRFMPPDLRQLADDPQAMRQRILAAAEERTRALRGRIAEWDAVNEPYTHTDAANVIGESIYADVFKAARKGDPDVRLFINDFGILSGGGADTAHQAHYEKTIQNILDAGGDLGGIGFQGHFGGQVTEPDRVLQILDRFARFGVPLQVTEFDVDVNDEQLRADYTRDLMITLFSHPAVSGFVMWGFWEGQHWKPRTAMVARDWTFKPNGLEYKQLVLDEWWTRHRGQTNALGQVTTRGFLGDYRITVTHQGRTVARTASLTNQGLDLTLELPD